MAVFPPQDLAMRIETEKGTGDPQDLSMRTEEETRPERQRGGIFEA